MKMPSRLKVDHAPKNGHPGKVRGGDGHSLFSPSSTKGVGYKKGAVSVADKGVGFATAKPGAKVTKAAGKHMPEEGARSRPGGQYSAGSGAAKGHSKGIADSSATFATGKKAGVPKSQMADSTPKHSGNVPRGEHHAAGHREPRSHEEFHKLGSGHWK